MICATSGVSQWVPIVYVWHIKENMRRTLKTKSLLNQNLCDILQNNKVSWQW